MSRRKDQERARRQRQWERENARFASLHAQAARLKPWLRSKGYDLPFYDGLDSYAEEFRRIAAEARADHTSLLGVEEVEDADYFAKGAAAPGRPELTQVFFETREAVADYG